jgi:hypothetical protein
MLCLEVYRNGEEVCTAGVGEYGLAHADVMRLSHRPERQRSRRTHAENRRSRVRR